MGTRGVFGFRINGQDKVTYNHFDSYPDGLGKKVLQSLRQETVEHLKEIAGNIRLVDEGVPATKEEVFQCQKWKDLDVSTQQDTDWYCLLRKAQGSLKAWLTDGLPCMIDSVGFLQDSLFCEFAYLINLDAEVLEFYIGFNKDPSAPGRYVNPNLSNSNGYYGVALRDTVPLSSVLGATTRATSGLIKRWNKLDKEN